MQKDKIQRGIPLSEFYFSKISLGVEAMPSRAVWAEIDLTAIEHNVKVIKKKIQVEGAKVLVLGLSFKENCPDIRNTKIIDIVHELQEYHIQADVYDPWVDASEAEYEYGITPVQTLENGL